MLCGRSALPCADCLQLHSGSWSSWHGKSCSSVRSTSLREYPTSVRLDLLHCDLKWLIWPWQLFQVIMFRWWHGRKKNSLPVPSETIEVWRCRWCFPFAFNISDSKVSLKGLAAGMCLLPCFMNLNGFGHQATSCSWQVAGRSTAYLQSDASDSECKHGMWRSHVVMESNSTDLWLLQGAQVGCRIEGPGSLLSRLGGRNWKLGGFEATNKRSWKLSLWHVVWTLQGAQAHFFSHNMFVNCQFQSFKNMHELGKFERVEWWIQGKAKATWDGTILIVLLSLWNRVAQGGYEQAFSFARSNDQFVLSVEWCWASVL